MLKSTKIASRLDQFLLEEFDYLEEHRGTVSRHFLAMKSQAEANFEKECASLTEEDAGYEEVLIEQARLNVETLPRLQWYSQFLLVYSLFEHTLNQLCSIVEKRSVLPISVKDLHGQGIERAKLYFTKMVNVNTPFQTPDWTRTTILGKVRNAIAHRNGELESSEKLVAQLNGLPNMELAEVVRGCPENVFIKLSPEFIEDAIKTLKKVLLDVANFELYAIKIEPAQSPS